MTKYRDSKHGILTELTRKKTSHKINIKNKKKVFLYDMEGSLFDALAILKENHILLILTQNKSKT